MKDQKKPRLDANVLVLHDDAAMTNLQPLQSAIATGDEGAITAALNQILDESSDERVLLERISVLVAIKEEEAEEEEEEEKDEDEEEKDDDDDSDLFGDNGSSRTPPPATAAETVPMSLIVTTERCLFVADTFIAATAAAITSNNSIRQRLDNFCIDAEAIQLHAQSADPVSIYLQIQEGNDDEASPKEISIFPTTKEEADKIKTCETLFSAITRLIELHPVQEDTSADGNGMMMGMMSSIMSMMQQQSTTTTTTQAQEKHLVNDGMASREVTPEDRAAMLERLDSLLVVKPGLEIEMADGQFEDAEEEEEEEEPEQVEQGQERNEKADEPSSEETPAMPMLSTSPEPKSTAKGGGQFDDADDDEDDPLL
jgi:hypothetical protein